MKLRVIMLRYYDPIFYLNTIIAYIGGLAFGN